jgi:hypothetical protein
LDSDFESSIVKLQLQELLKNLPAPLSKQNNKTGYPIENRQVTYMNDVGYHTFLDEVIADTLYMCSYNQ